MGPGPPRSGASLRFPHTCDRGAQRVIQEFREFVNRGNFVEMAVAFVTGLASVGVVTADRLERLVADAAEGTCVCRPAVPRSPTILRVRISVG